MLGRIPKSTLSVFLVSGVVVHLTVSHLWADEPPAENSPNGKPPAVASPDAASADDENRPLDVAADLLAIRERNLELLRQVQSKRVSVELRNTPLDHTITHLSELSGIPMQLDVVALEELGLPGDTECSIRVKDARVSSVLSRLLDRFDLGWTIENESLQITTNEVISEDLHTMVFTAGDVVSSFEQNMHVDQRRDRFGFVESADFGINDRTGFGSGGSASENLLELIQRHTGGHWVEFDGRGGTLSFEAGVLTVHQSLPVLLNVEAFLERLRYVQKQPPSTDVWVIPEKGFGLPENKQVMKALRKPISVKFAETPLEDAIAQIAKESEIQVGIDVEALQEAGLTEDEPIDLTMSATSGSVLKQIFVYLELAWLIKDDTCEVTTREVANERLFTVVADARELLSPGRISTDGLIDIIQNESNGLWETVDGVGGSIHAVGGLVFFRQTQETIAEVAVLLQDLKSRAALIDSSKAAGANRKSGGMETRFYRAESKEDAEALMTALTSFVFPDTWETNGGDGVMVEVGSKLVIRQTPEVHKAITEFIRELQAAE